MKDLITEALDLHVAALEDERLPDGRYHPSSMWLCGRATILAVRGIEVASPPDKQTKRVFRIGHLYHQLVQDALPGHPKIKNVWVEFGIDVPEWNVAGHGDALVETVDGDFWVIEIKSTKSLRFTPKEDHKKQGATYATAVRDFGCWVEPEDAPDELTYEDPLGKDLKGLILVYLNKQDLDIKEYVYPYDPAWRTMIERKVKELDAYRTGERTDQLPPPLPLDKGKPNWFTGYCPYKGSGQCCGDPQEDELDDW